MPQQSQVTMQDSRRFNRVNVQLAVAVRRSNSEVFLTQSLDISEGGVLLQNTGDCPLEAGELVKVHIDGILGEDNNQMILHSMRVIRVGVEKIALEFN